MPIINRTGDLLEQEDIRVIAQLNNLECKFGAGLALAIKNKYPEAYAADCETEKGDVKKLGTFSFARTWDGKCILNVYAMPTLGQPGRNVSYDAFVTAFEKIEKIMREKSKTPASKVLGVPWQIGAGLAGGSYAIIEAILKDIFEESPIKLEICKL